MIRHRFCSLLTAVLLGVFITPGQVRGHEVVGEVTPLMLHMQHTLTLIENGRKDGALRMVMKIYEDFQDPMRPGTEAGLTTNSIRVDHTFGTASKSLLTSSIKQKDLKGLQDAMRLLSFLLMLEKFDVLKITSRMENVNEEAQRTIFWLGRNYFSYLLEPAMGKQDPIEEKRLDRLLDRMLYSVEDREWETFMRLREELTEGTIRFFELPMPGLPVEASRK